LEKKLGICTPGSRLLSGMDIKAHELADDFIRDKQIEILYNTPFIEGV